MDYIAIHRSETRKSFSSAGDVQDFLQNKVLKEWKVAYIPSTAADHTKLEGLPDLMWAVDPAKLGHITTARCFLLEQNDHLC
jgi:hypothetical protein